MKTIDYSYFIENYIAGEMSPAEEAWFKKELEGNESLQKEVQLRKRTEDMLRKSDIISLRSKLASIEKMRLEKPVSSTRIKTPRFRYAAVITGLVIIGSLYLMVIKKESPENIFNNYYKSFENSGTTRSIAPEANLNKAFEYYDKGEFAKALEGFRSYLEVHAWSPRYEFLSGVSSMEIKNFPDATTSFKKVLLDNNNLFIEEAEWRLALCCIKTKDISTAKDQLQKIAKSRSVYNKQAREILRQL